MSTNPSALQSKIFPEDTTVATELTLTAGENLDNDFVDIASNGQVYKSRGSFFQAFRNLVPENRSGFFARYILKNGKILVLSNDTVTNQTFIRTFTVGQGGNITVSNEVALGDSYLSGHNLAFVQDSQNESRVFLGLRVTSTNNRFLLCVDTSGADPVVGTRVAISTGTTAQWFSSVAAHDDSPMFGLAYDPNNNAYGLFYTNSSNAVIGRSFTVSGTTITISGESTVVSAVGQFIYFSPYKLANVTQLNNHIEATADGGVIYNDNLDRFCLVQHRQGSATFRYNIAFDGTTFTASGPFNPAQASVNYDSGSVVHCPLSDVDFISDGNNIRFVRVGLTSITTVGPNTSSDNFLYFVFEESANRFNFVSTSGTTPGGIMNSNIIVLNASTLAQETLFNTAYSLVGDTSLIAVNPTNFKTIKITQDNASTDGLDDIVGQQAYDPVSQRTSLPIRFKTNFRYNNNRPYSYMVIGDYVLFISADREYLFKTNFDTILDPINTPIGFVQGSVTSGQSATILIVQPKQGKLIDGFTGLTPGSFYFAKEGELSTQLPASNFKGINPIKIDSPKIPNVEDLPLFGLAISSTQILQFGIEGWLK